jgi:hypothetical protein
MLQGPWAGSMQNMHPQLGAAVEQFSTFTTEPWPRVLRSLYPIGGVVFDTDRATSTGAEVRDYHTTIKGVDAKGRRFHALNPDVSTGRTRRSSSARSSSPRSSVAASPRPTSVGCSTNTWRGTGCME